MKINNFHLCNRQTYQDMQHIDKITITENLYYEGKTRYELVQTTY